jgi:hypothetical protein
MARRGGERALVPWNLEKNEEKQVLRTITKRTTFFVKSKYSKREKGWQRPAANRP